MPESNLVYGTFRSTGWSREYGFWAPLREAYRPPGLNEESKRLVREAISFVRKYGLPLSAQDSSTLS